MRVRSAVRISRHFTVLLLSGCFFFSPFLPSAAADDPPAHGANLVVNPDFSQGTSGWSGLWTRDPGQGRSEIVARGADGQAARIVIEHRGDKDWSYQQANLVAALPGEIYRYGGLIAFSGKGQAELSVVLYDRDGKVRDWSFARTIIKKTNGLTTSDRKFIVPSGVSAFRFRLTGTGPGTTSASGFSLLKVSGGTAAKNATVALGNAKAGVRFNAADNTLVLTPKGRGRPVVFEGFGANIMPGSLRVNGRTSLSFAVFNAFGDDAQGACSLRPDGSVLFTLRGNGRMEEEVHFPGVWRAAAGSSWIIPENEGLLVPVNDPYYDIPWGKTLYSGHGLCMPFLGLTDGEQGAIIIVETADDVGVRFARPAADAMSAFSLTWQPQTGMWGYERKFQVVFIPEHGYVGAAKAYREFARAKGLLVTLKEKAKTAPAAARLPGSVDLWYWKKGPEWWREDDPRAMAREMYDAGITRVLWSNECGAEAVKAMNDLGFITGRYDIYQDVYPPDSPGWLAKLNAEAWPSALTLDRYGERISGWVHRENGREYPAGVVCSRPGWDMLKQHVAADLKDKPYRARFIDTTTASPLRECYHPAHPLTRSGDRTWKTQQLSYLSREMRLVTGSETGSDWAVPALHYFEGMMSLGDARLPDSGYDLWSVKPPTDQFLRFQVGPYYRVPLFELVYHDCVANFPYWGDASNRLADWWDVRDLYAALYGTGPLWIVDEARWKKDKERFVKSYRTATTVAARTGLVEMLEHRFLTADHTVQYTRFADNTEVWVNFGAGAYRLPDGRLLESHGLVIK